MNKIGEVVKIVNVDYTYRWHEEWFYENNEFIISANFDYGNEPPTEDTYIIVARHGHSDEANLIYALQNKSTGKIYLMDEYGFIKS